MECFGVDKQRDAYTVTRTPFSAEERDRARMWPDCSGAIAMTHGLRGRLFQGRRFGLGLKPKRLADQVERPTFAFAVNPSHILADNPKADQLHAAEEQDRDDQERPSTDPIAGPEAEHERIEN